MVKTFVFLAINFLKTAMFAIFHEDLVHKVWKIIYLAALDQTVVSMIRSCAMERNTGFVVDNSLLLIL